MPKGVYDRSRSRQPVRPNRKEQILKAATKVYGYYGFEGATIDRIALAAGVSRSLVLEHFGTKQGLVKAIVEHAVQKNLQKIRRIDEIPGLTLRERERRIHDIIRPDREEWCLILGTVLVPDFQFQMRGEITGYVQENYRAVLQYRSELKIPTEEMAFSYAYTTICTHIGYIMGGREKSFQLSMAHLLDSYLLPEPEIPDEKAEKRYY